MTVAARSARSARRTNRKRKANKNNNAGNNSAQMPPYNVGKVFLDPFKLLGGAV